MNTFSRACVAAIGFAAIAGSAPAQIVVSIDADPSTGVIDSTRMVAGGENFSVNLVVELQSAADSLSIYGITVRFNNLELALDGLANENDPAVVDLGNPLSPFALGGLSQTADRAPLGLTGTDDGEVGSFEAWNLTLAATGPRTWVAGTIPFTVLTPVADAIVDVRPGAFTGLDGLYDSLSALVPATFNGMTLILIPEPVSTRLLSLGLVGLVLGLMVRRRRRNA